MVRPRRGTDTYRVDGKPAPSEAAPLEPGALLGRFVLGEQIGRPTTTFRSHATLSGEKKTQSSCQLPRRRRDLVEMNGIEPSAS